MSTFQRELPNDLKTYIKKRYKELKKTDPFRLRASLRGFMLSDPASEEAIPRHGIAIQAPGATGVLDGSKLLLVSPIVLEHENENLYLIQDNLLLGIVRIEFAETCALDELVLTEADHHISPSDASLRWPGVKTFNLYRVFPVFTFSVDLHYLDNPTKLPSIIPGVSKKLNVF